MAKAKKAGIKDDRFKSPLEFVCKHDWQPFGFPLSGDKPKSRERCTKCKLVRTVEKAVNREA